ncbi:MAG: DinB family protein [Arthrobacter sp.]|nr:DinB family protein [Arthrobacter sp.]
MSPETVGYEASGEARPEPLLAAGEWETLTGFLDYHRATLAWKLEGLDAAGLGRRVGASSMTLGGLVKHLAYVEDEWAVHRLQGLDRVEPWDGIDWAADPDWDWNSAAEDSPEELLALWGASVERARAALEASYRAEGLGALLVRPLADGGRPSLRWLLVHLIEEYARHNGHADLLREAVDGRVGE